MADCAWSAQDVVVVLTALAGIIAAFTGTSTYLRNKKKDERKAAEAREKEQSSNDQETALQFSNHE